MVSNLRFYCNFEAAYDEGPLQSCNRIPNTILYDDRSDIDLYIALQASYPEHDHVWEDIAVVGHSRIQQRNKPHGYWNDINNQRQFFDQLAEKLGVQRLEDWYEVDHSIVLKEGPFISKQYNRSVLRGK
jgi:hypothetical protein